MQIICVSRGSLSKGREFADSLARKLDVPCLSRESLVEQATAEGIAVGKLEMAMVRQKHLDERMILEKEHFQAFATKVLCEHALEGSLLYHGRTGHLVLPGLSHVLRVRVITDMETRIDAVMQRLRLERAKAKDYIEQVEEDRRRWVRVLYNVDWEASPEHDLIVNLERVSVDSATTSLCGYAQLPEFQATPASVKAVENLLLAARARLALARDERTWSASFQVRASEGVLSVTYLPKFGAMAARVPEVLGKLGGVQDLTCSMASTNILWIQERFDVSSPAFDGLVRLAHRWDAAVELFRLIPVESQPEVEEVLPGTAPEPLETLPSPISQRRHDGGIEDDVRGPEEPAPGMDDGGLHPVYDELNRRGIAGSMRSVPASPRQMSLAIDRTIPYSLVVIGDVFLDKGHAAQVRLSRELASQMGDTLKVPVIKADELKSQYLVGSRQYLRIAAFAALVAALYYVVFTHQKEALAFLTPETTLGKVLAAACLMVFIPILAYLYGTLTKTILKLVHIE